MSTACYLPFLLLLVSSFCSGQVNPVTWNFSSEKNAETEYTLTFIAEVIEGWSIYSQHTDPSGPIPTSFIFEENENIELIGDTEETGNRKEAFDDLFGVNVIKFNGTVTFTQKIKVKNGNANVTGFLEFMCCDEEKCLPPKEVDFSFSLN